MFEQFENLKQIDSVLFQQYQENFVQKFNKKINYGTAGFREKAEYLDYIAHRSAVFISVIQKSRQNQVMSLMITASHNPRADNGFKIIDFDGGMLRQVYENEIFDFVNEQDLEKAINVVKARVEEVEKVQYDLNQQGTAFIGRDTRPSSDKLNDIATKSFELCGMRLFDYGLVSTPQLHFYTMNFNASNDENKFNSSINSIKDSYKVYFDKYFKLLLSTGQQQSQKPNTVVDCSQGVGGLMIKECIALNDSALTNNLNIEVINIGDQTEYLNDRCGAEFVQKERQYPRQSEIFKQYLEQNQEVRCCCFDGDADRSVYFLPDPEFKQLKLIEGDKIAAFFAFYVQNQLQKIKGLLAQYQDLKLSQNLDWEIGVVLTGYANGSCTDYCQNVLKVTVKLAKTGVKNSHPIAHHFDIGIYFESNGHGALLVNNGKYEQLEQIIKEVEQHGLSNSELHTQLIQLNYFLRLSNQSIGDAYSNFLLVEGILITQGISNDQFEQLYVDLPNRTSKVVVKDKSQIQVTPEETRVVTPIEIQNNIDAVVAKYSKARAFIRPSGTEDIVRLYVEAEFSKDVDEITTLLQEMLLNDKTIN